MGLLQGRYSRPEERRPLSMSALLGRVRRRQDKDGDGDDRGQQALG
jgi:hypothetical protein